MIAHYAWNGREEYCLASLSGKSRCCLILPPLFDEANRTRRLLASAMRALAQCGHDSIMPDLPGTNESTLPLSESSLAIWRDAVGAAIGQLAPDARIFTIALRGGCLLDDAAGAQAMWRLAPAKGTQLLRTMVRTRIASEKEVGRSVAAKSLTEMGRNEGIELAGNVLSAEMFGQMEAAIPSDGPNLHMAGFEGDDRDADSRIAGSPLWLRAEPGDDPAMARSMTENIVQWIDRCDAS